MQLKRIFLFLLLLLIVILGLKYRLRSYQYFPPIASTFDEQVLVWVGSSLINTGIPTGWSYIGDYRSENKGHLVNLDGWSISFDRQKPSLSNFSQFPKPLSHDRQITLDGYTTQFTLVQPFLEQPPLGAVLASFLSGSFLQKGLEDVSLKNIRIPVIILSTLSIFLVYLVGYFAYGTGTGLLSALIFSLAPIFVISQRIATAENYLTFFFLLGVLCTQLWIFKNKNIFFYFAAFLIIVCYLIKPFGISLALFLSLVILFFEKDKKLLLWPVGSTILAIAIFFSYGFFYDGELFKKLVIYQGNRLFSPLSALFKIVIPKITKVFLDGWVIFGWIATGGLLLRQKLRSDFWILAPLLSFVLILFLFGGEDSGWYRLPTYPFLALASGVLIKEAISKANPWVGVIFLITVFASSLWWGTFGISWVENGLVFRALMIVLILLMFSIYLKFNKAKFVTSALITSLFVLSLWFNIQTINQMQKIWPTLGDETSMIPFRK